MKTKKKQHIIIHEYSMFYILIKNLIDEFLFKNLQIFIQFFREKIILFQ